MGGGDVETWYHDLNEMEADDAHLQNIYAELTNQLNLCGKWNLRSVHAYPSMSCTYTLDKRRVFVRMRDENGKRYPDCILRYVLVHELAHVLNDTMGHDESFKRLLARLERCAQRDNALCPDAVAPDFNRCHR